VQALLSAPPAPHAVPSLAPAEPLGDADVEAAAAIAAAALPAGARAAWPGERLLCESTGGCLCMGGWRCA
jgi:hypothetical protein